MGRDARTFAILARRKTGYMKVRMQTSYGAVIIELEPLKAPKTVNNFIAYVRDGYYDGTLFHRVIDDFMIQGGGFLPGHDPEAHATCHRERGQERPAQ